MTSELNFYDLLEITSQASSDDIHDAYRAKSKLYHPDTTALPQEVALYRFQQLRKAYDTLSDPDSRKQYDYRVGVSTIRHIPRQYAQEVHSSPISSSFEQQERPLSPGELVALLILGITFFACLALALILGVARGEMMFHNVSPSADIAPAPYVVIRSSLAHVEIPWNRL